MTHHLSDQQLGALRDRALSAGDTAAAERHVAQCERCRAQLAELAALDAALAGALERDPGEEYFASFADRVGARIASQARAGATAAHEPRRGLAAWWSSPRRLAWAGGALGLVAVAALVATLAREHGPQEMATQVAPARELGTNPSPPRAGSPAESRADQALKSSEDAGAPASEDGAAPAPAPAPDTRGLAGSFAPRTLVVPPAARPALTPPPAPLADRAAPEAPGDANRMGASARDEAAAPPKFQEKLARTGHAEEVRTLPSGEQEVVARRPQFAPAPPLKLPGGFSKPAATPLGGEPPVRQGFAGDGATRKSALERKGLAAPPAAGAPMAETQGGNLIQASRESVPEGSVPSVAICGQVRDARGRPAARALVTVPETGATTTAGPDGAFCVDVPGSGGTLAVLAVGFRPYRARVTAADASAPLAITLSAVDVMSPPALSARREGSAHRGEGTRGTSRPPSLARRAALDASAAAAKAATAEAWTNAAHRWETVALLEPPSSDAEPGFHVAEARVNAWLIGRTPAQRAAARDATQAFLDHAPDGTSRDIALGWNRVLER